MEKIVLKVDRNPDLSFTGDSVARGRSHQKGTTTTVYETAKGHWLLAETNDRTNLLTRHVVIENKSEEKLIETLGFDDVAKAIYSQLHIDTSDQLDI